MEFTTEQFNRLKGEAEKYYADIDSVWCPYFQAKVNFNKKGWEHLIFKAWNRTRSIQDQYSRLRHMKLTTEVISNSKTLQGIWTTQKLERTRRKNSKWTKVMKLVTYYEFIAVMESRGSKVRVKIIVKQVDGGERFFYSLIPFWGRDRYGDRALYSGNPEED